MMRFIGCNAKLILLSCFNCMLLTLNYVLWNFAPPTRTFNFNSVQYKENSISQKRSDCSDKLGQLIDSDTHRLDEVNYSENKSQNDIPLNLVDRTKPFNDVFKTVFNDRSKKIAVKSSKDFQSFSHLTETDYKNYLLPSIETTTLVNCASLLSGDETELQKAESVHSTIPKVPIYEETYIQWTRDCDGFKRRRGYVTQPLSQEEADFPLAFSITMFTDVEQVERLLRAIYQPQNLYCIHIDTKASLLIHQTMNAIADCFDNVWIAEHLDKIKWGDISVILLDVNCMRDLVKYYRGRFKYFINLTGQELPLRTNLELVKIAKIFNGSNDIGGSVERMDLDRVRYVWTHRWSKTYQQTIYYQTNRLHPPYSTNITFFKGELHGLFSRRMVEYIVESEHGSKYLEWCSDTGHPSEHYYNTLNYNEHLGAPGGYSGPLKLAHEYSIHPIVRVKNWVYIFQDLPCNGEIVRGICVYGVRDAPWLAKRLELFANKFHLTRQYLTIDCLEERHRNRTALGESLDFPYKIYSSLPTVLYGRKDGL